MSRGLRTDMPTLERARADICARLRSRCGEIEQTMLARVYAVSDPAAVNDPEYVAGLKDAVSTALDYGLSAIEWGEARSSSVPPALLAQARQAARNGVSLDTVLRRYFAGYTLLGDFVVQEANCEPLGVDAIHRLGRDQAASFDRLLGAVTAEYARESEDRLGSAEERRVERVRRLLAGHLLDTSQLGYELDAWHLGVLVSGPGAAEAIRDFATALDRYLLLIRGGEGKTWAWLGGRHRVDPTEIERLISSNWPTPTALAVGEPAHGLAGWRLTHRQAQAAMPIALRSPRKLVRYVDVALPASMLQDDLLATSLRQLYLAPLSAERDGGKTLRKTLRAYISAERNLTSAASALGVSRRTIANRLRSIETKLERPLNVAMGDVEAALRLHDLDALSVNSAEARKSN
jgi:PucR C-terminal helix-turn-helix domain/GGDEF-like domain